MSSVSFACFFGDAKDLGNLGVRHSSKKAELDDFGLEGCFGGEFVQGLVNAKQHFRARLFRNLKPLS